MPSNFAGASGQNSHFTPHSCTPHALYLGFVTRDSLLPSCNAQLIVAFFSSRRPVSMVSGNRGLGAFELSGDRGPTRVDFLRLPQPAQHRHCRCPVGVLFLPVPNCATSMR